MTAILATIAGNEGLVGAIVGASMTAIFAVAFESIRRRRLTDQYLKMVDAEATRIGALIHRQVNRASEFSDQPKARGTFTPAFFEHQAYDLSGLARVRAEIGRAPRWIIDEIMILEAAVEETNHYYSTRGTMGQGDIVLYIHAEELLRGTATRVSRKAQIEMRWLPKRWVLRLRDRWQQRRKARRTSADGKKSPSTEDAA